MVAGARTYPLEDTFLAPQVLEPPPTRHALFAFLLALAAVFHIGTAAWGDLYDGSEGRVAGSAREMLQSRQWLVPTNNGTPILDTPPLATWIVAASCKMFGVNAAAARIPGALAMIGSVALTFLIGERIAGYWRGFSAGLIHICSAGGLLLGRMVSSDAFAAFFVSASIYCAVCGYQHRKSRRLWFAVFAICAVLACLATGLVTLIYPAGPCLILAIFFREVRIRFAPLLHWSNLLLFGILVAPWYVWAQTHFPGLLSHEWANSFSGTSGRSLIGLIVCWLPALIFLAPALLVAPRKIFRPTEFTAADALPLLWMAVALAGFFLNGNRGLSPAIFALPGFALFAASAWDRSSPRLRAFGIVLALLATLSIALLFLSNSESLRFVGGRPLPEWVWPSIRPLAQIAFAALVVCFLAALFALRKQRTEVALLLAVAAMMPVGLCFTEARSRLASFFSLADAARYLNPRLGSNGQVLVEADLANANSLTFYLEKKFFLVNDQPGFFERDAESQNKYLDEHVVLEAWQRSSPIYLIIDENRVSYWRTLIVDRVHIFHQVTTCGSRVILSNQL